MRAYVAYDIFQICRRNVIFGLITMTALQAMNRCHVDLKNDMVYELAKIQAMNRGHTGFSRYIYKNKI